MKKIISWALIIIGVILCILQVISLVGTGGIPAINLPGYALGFYLGLLMPVIIGIILIVVGNIIKNWGRDSVNVKREIVCNSCGSINPKGTAKCSICGTRL